ncbi:hypothetical protein, conserved [Leishmania tarentolae]|uniref:Uncharacterized protein n=1 Tax=Leishmania tarentolae TaxID=5689 RepID=A0A640KI73_LEITA|nr:hypothetical protein, conserved [Leishmania tarentolae]
MPVIEMSGHRCTPSVKLAPPVPSPSPSRDEASVHEVLKDGRFSAEGTIASMSTTGSSRPSTNAVAAAAHNDFEGVTTSSPSNSAGSTGREGSENSQSESCRTPSAHVHPVQFTSPEGPCVTGSAAAALEGNEALLPLMNSPVQHSHKSAEASGTKENASHADEDLGDTALRSPLRRGASHANEAENLTQRDHLFASAAEISDRGAEQGTSSSHLSAGSLNNVTIGCNNLPLNGAPQSEDRAQVTCGAGSMPRCHIGGTSPVEGTAFSMPRPSGGCISGDSAPRTFSPEYTFYDQRLSAAATTSPAGMNNSGCMPSPRALVQYVAPSCDRATPSYGCRDPAISSDAGYSPSRHAEIRAMLITAERELADVREECAKRGMRADTLEAELNRERANLRSLRDRYADETAAAREEHEAQIRQLRDQLQVLKMVSENAMAEKSKAAEDATRRKKELLELLDREREEKSYIMADYREQTESLIAEQGREITYLRGALDKLKGEYDDLAKRHLTTEEELEELQEKLENATVQLDKERSDAASKTKDLQTNMQQECQVLTEQLATMQENLQRAATQHAAKQQSLTDQLQKSEEKQRIAEEEYQHTLDTLKQAYRRDTDSLREELNRLKETHNKQEEEWRHDLEKAARRETKSVEALRQALEQVRQEKELSVEDSFKQRDVLQRQHREKVAALQKELDQMVQQLAEECEARKDREADVQVLRVRAENLEKATQRLSNELETIQADQRSRERSTEQAHQAAIEAMRTKLRTALTDLGYAQDQLKQQVADAQQLNDELAKRTSALDAAKDKIVILERTSADELGKAKDTALQREKEAAQVIAQLRTSKTQLEASCEQLERQLREMEGRVQGTAKQVNEERRSLEEANRRLQDARVEVEDLRTVVNHERERGTFLQEEKRQVERQLAEEKLYREELENQLHITERKLQEQQQDHARQLQLMEGKLEEQEQRQHAELAASRIAAEQVRGEVSRAREAIVEKETALQRMREEVGRLHREAAMREGGLQEEMEDLREAHEVEIRRMDEVLNGLRSDLAKSQAACTQYQRELSQIHQNSAGARSDLEMALEQADAARAKLLEDAKYREQLNQELQGTVRLLSSRLTSNEEEVRRMQEELADTNKRIQDAHTLIGRKDAAIGQLNAKLRAYESRH